MLAGHGQAVPCIVHDDGAGVHASRLKTQGRSSWISSSPGKLPAPSEEDGDAPHLPLYQPIMGPFVLRARSFPMNGWVDEPPTSPSTRATCRLTAVPCVAAGGGSCWPSRCRPSASRPCTVPCRWTTTTAIIRIRRESRCTGLLAWMACRGGGKGMQASQLSRVGPREPS